MKANEMALEFMDQLQKISSGAAPSLEDYELSFALSTAEEEFIKTRYNAKSNSKREGFENSEKRRKDLARLVTNTVIKAQDINNSSFFTTVDNKPNGSFWCLPEDLLWVLNEEISWEGQDCYDGVRVDVKPLEHDHYNVVIKNTFTKPYNHLVYRLDYGSEFSRNDENFVTIKFDPFKSTVFDSYVIPFSTDLYGDFSITVPLVLNTIDLMSRLEAALNTNYPLLTTSLYLSKYQLTISDSNNGKVDIDLAYGYISDIAVSNRVTYQVHELITHGWSIKEYYVRYIKKPDGIIVNFDDPSKQVDSVLNDITHREIISIAVKNTLAVLQDPRYGAIAQDNLNKE